MCCAGLGGSRQQEMEAQHPSLRPCLPVPVVPPMSLPPSFPLPNPQKSSAEGCIVASFTMEYLILYLNCLILTKLAFNGISATTIVSTFVVMTSKRHQLIPHQRSYHSFLVILLVATQLSLSFSRIFVNYSFEECLVIRPVQGALLLPHPKRDSPPSHLHHSLVPDEHSPDGRRP